MKRTETKGDKNRMIIQELRKGSTTDYEIFLQRLGQSDQHNIINVLKDVKEKVLSLKSTDPKTNNEDIFYSGTTCFNTT